MTNLSKLYSRFSLFHSTMSYEIIKYFTYTRVQENTMKTIVYIATTHNNITTLIQQTTIGSYSKY